MREGPEIEELAPVSGTAPGGHAGHPRLAADARLGSSSRGVLRSAAIVIALIGLAIIKPWDAVGGTGRGSAGDLASVPPASAGEVDGAGGLPGVATQPPAAAATPAGPVLAPGQLGCGAPDGWRLVTLGWLAGRP